MNAQNGYKPGDKASDFTLKNVDGKMVSLKNSPEAKGFIVIFSCNHCPYVKAYEDRIIELDKKYKAKGYPVIAINPNDPDIVPEDSYEKMQERAKEKGFTFPYLFDEKQEVFKIYGATRTPHVYFLNKEGNDLTVVYIGAIDDNYQDAAAVKEKYLENAIAAVMNGEKVSPDFTKAIGCSIKVKK
ncbi:thioredoxin family protein [Bacteroidota bacterium]